eukprot:1145112-Pelagomonas_calceolata.AAC.12
MRGSLTTSAQGHAMLFSFFEMRENSTGNAQGLGQASDSGWLVSACPSLTILHSQGVACVCREMPPATCRRRACMFYQQMITSKDTA